MVKSNSQTWTIWTTRNAHAYPVNNALWVHGPWIGPRYHVSAVNALDSMLLSICLTYGDIFWITFLCPNHLGKWRLIYKIFWFKRIIRNGILDCWWSTWKMLWEDFVQETMSLLVGIKSVFCRSYTSLHTCLKQGYTKRRYLQGRKYRIHSFYFLRQQIQCSSEKTLFCMECIRTQFTLVYSSAQPRGTLF